MANDVALLHRTLDAAALPNGAADALGTREVFKRTTARLPEDGDTLIFAQLGTLTDRMKSLLAASGQPVDPKQLAELQRMQAVAWGTKLEGAQLRDTIYLLAPGGVDEAALPRNTLALSAAETFLYYGMALPAKIDLPESTGLLGGYLTMLAPMEKELAGKGLKWNDLGVAFGPELGVLADWGAEAPSPSALLAVDVRDPEKARAFLDVFTASAPGKPGWVRSEKDGVTLFQSPRHGPAPGFPLARADWEVPGRRVQPGGHRDGAEPAEKRAVRHRADAGVSGCGENGGRAHFGFRLSGHEDAH